MAAILERLTNGIGEAVNPAWNPDGEHLAFAWTQGYAPGSFNIFWMEVASHRYVQLTKAAGKNENPSWAPDGDAHCIRVQPQRILPDLEHAGGWHAGPATHHAGEQQQPRLGPIIDGLSALKRQFYVIRRCQGGRAHSRQQ